MIHASLWLFLAMVASPPDSLHPIGKVSKASIHETSGIVKSRKHPGVFWIQSDSGNPPTIHAIDASGKVVRSFRVAILNVDWEDIATDAAGHLYLAETGNNGHLLPLRAIYQLDEPDPALPPNGDLPVRIASFYRFASRNERFDAESLFIAGKIAFLIEKRLDGRVPGIFAIPLDPPAPLMNPAIPRRIGDLPDFHEPATGADLSPDGRRLAVVSNRETKIYDRTADGRLTLRATVRYKKRDIESIAWDGFDLILATEAGELFRIARSTWME
jgi:hypothetical protein